MTDKLKIETRDLGKSVWMTSQSCDEIFKRELMNENGSLDQLSWIHTSLSYDDVICCWPSLLFSSTAWHLMVCEEKKKKFRKILRTREMFLSCCRSTSLYNVFFFCLINYDEKCAHIESRHLSGNNNIK